ncbi:MAG: hypothetical protein HUJ71_01105 [Pseudobutyrivibrio sp.]|nr:hypothetical protein [Pseudobutyrivibrio sp.]
MKKRIARVIAAMVVVCNCIMPITISAEEYDKCTKDITNVNELDNRFYRKDEYLVVSNPSVIIEQDSIIFESKVGVSEEELLLLYNDYLATTCSQNSLIKKDPEILLKGFTEEAVRKGIIENTPLQRAALTKAVVRAEFKVVVAGGSKAGYTTAAALLDHSLQDAPANLSYTTSSVFASQIAKSSECKSIVDEFKKQVNGSNISKKTMTGSTVLNSTTDLHLAYNKVSYSAVGNKANGKWNLTITFSDKYDFETQTWTNSMTDRKVVTILNNYAAYAQSIGAIVPYNIKVSVSTSF